MSNFIAYNVLQRLFKILSQLVLEYEARFVQSILWCLPYTLPYLLLEYW